MKEHEHLILGCLLHDIGKFFERAELLEHYRNNNEKQQGYCKWNEQGHYFSHKHVLNTLAFCENLTECVPELKPDEQQSSKNADQNWINLAAHHHNPSQQAHNYLEKIVQTADHFASAEREQGDFYTKNIHKKTRLESLLGRVSLEEQARENSCFLPLTSLSLEPQAIYPKLANQLGMQKQKTTKGEGWLSEKSLVHDYKMIAQNLLGNLDKLQNFQSGTDKQKLFASILRSLLGLMEQSLSQIPAATNVRHPDISLFDHLRITAAIGEGLFLYHQAKGDLGSARYKDAKVAKWKLVCGDFSGIQKFIYKITSKGAAKGLRGRSLFIQLLCDAVSEQIIRELDLYPTARIYSSGGKFYLLIPAHLDETLQQEVDKVNEELLHQFQGEIYLGIGMSELCEENFRAGNMGQCWKTANEDLQKNRLQPFVAQVSQDIECFASQSQYTSDSCKVCGRDDLAADLKDSICSQCNVLQQIGKELTETQYIFWAWKKDRTTVNNKLKNYLQRVELPGTDCTLYFLTESPEFSELTDLSDSHLESINHLSGFTANQQGYSQGFRFIGKWDKEKESGQWEFDDFADHATGISRMGVLRMDVDNLGQVFIRGLRFKKQGKTDNMGSLSRVATLSRQLHLFFAGYLQQMLKKFPHTQLIYAGGDDVFIIGSWDELPVVAETIKNEFLNYCANNPSFTLSGGIAMVGGRYPISQSAQLAGDAEEMAKNLVRGHKEKDALWFLDTAIGWESYEDAKQLRDDILDICKETNSQALIERLRQVVLSVQEVKQRQSHLATEQQMQELLYWDKWRWRLVYNLKRMARRYRGIENKLTNIQKQLIDTQMLTGKQPALDWLQLSLRWAEFSMRKKIN